MNTGLYCDREYFSWLCNFIEAGYDRPYAVYRKLLWRLYLTPFTSLDIYDNDRAADGKQLRLEYGGRIFADEHENSLCSMLEMMIAFSQRIEAPYLYKFNTERAYVWFWLMVQSLGLDSYQDDCWDDEQTNNPVDICLCNFNYRARDSAGMMTNPLFRLSSPEKYNRTLWDQMMAWVTENYDTLYAINPRIFTINYIMRY